MADGRHFENIEKIPYLGNGLADCHEILQNDVHWFSEPYPQFKSRLIKNTRRRRFWKKR